MYQTISIKSSEFQPLPDYLLVKPEELDKEEKSQSGIVIGIQRSVVDRPSCGKIIKAGPNDLDLYEDDYIIWPSTDGIDAEFTDGKFLLLKVKSVIGKQVK